MSATDILTKIFGLFGVTPSGNSDVMAITPDILTSSLNRYQLHRDNYRRMVKVVLVQGVILILLIVMGCWLVVRAQPHDRFFTAAPDGRVQRVWPLDVAQYSDQQIAGRVATYVVESLSFGARDYEINRVRGLKFFSPEALNQLHAQLLGKALDINSISIDTAFKAELDTSRGGGVVRGEVGSDYVREWEVVVPLKLSRMDDLTGEKTEPMPWMVRVLVRRSAKVEVRQGFLIERVLQMMPLQSPAASAASSTANKGAL
jgi:hypothetical protein